jgi:hypothetical protein
MCRQKLRIIITFKTIISKEYYDIDKETNGQLWRINEKIKDLVNDNRIDTSRIVMRYFRIYVNTFCDDKNVTLVLISFKNYQIQIKFLFILS